MARQRHLSRSAETHHLPKRPGSLLDPIGSQCIGEIVTYLCFFIYLQSLPDQPRLPQVNPSEPK